MSADELAALKSQWNDVLYDLEAHNRTAWLALFDGRLASLDDGVLTLDFSDATKFSGAHEFERGLVIGSTEDLRRGAHAGVIFPVESADGLELAVVADAALAVRGEGPNERE